MATTMTTTSQSVSSWPSIINFRNRNETLWASLCRHCQQLSVNRMTKRSLQEMTAWDVSGPVLAQWNEILFPIINKYRNRNARDILRGHQWDGVVDCWMVGKTIEEALTHVVVTCSNEGVTKRFLRLIKKDPVVKNSGFKLCGRRGNILYRMYIPPRTTSFPDSTKSEPATFTDRGDISRKDGEYERKYEAHFDNISEPSRKSWLVADEMKRLNRTPQSSFNSSAFLIRKGQASDLKLPQGKGGGGFDKISRPQYKPGVAMQESSISTLCGVRIRVSKMGIPVYATLGGCILVNDKMMCITAAHPFLEKLSMPTLDLLKDEASALLTASDSEGSDSSIESGDKNYSRTPVRETPFRGIIDEATVVGCSMYLGPVRVGQFRGELTDTPNIADYGLSRDWALIELEAELIDSFRHAQNCFEMGSHIHQITQVSPADPEDEHVLVIQDGTHPDSYYCSGAMSMISLPGTSSMACGMRLTKGSIYHWKISAGISGSWVVSSADTTQLYGIVVAQDPADGDLLMLRARDVFTDIERVRGCSVSLPRYKKK